MPEQNLPKILYISDVPVELSSAGATLLYRLLEHYPKDKLLIIQGVGVSESQQRIPGVEYHVYKPKIDRLRYTRFSKHVQSLFLATHLLGSGKINRIAESFKPDIILTVSIRLMWVMAYNLSRKLGKPLYLVLHDDWLITENRGKWKRFLATMFRKTYIHAAERFCISPTMEKYYADMYGVHGKVIYPSRGKNDYVYPLQTHPKESNAKLKFCYAGSLFTGDFAPMLDMVSYHIGKNGGELHVFSYWNKELLSKYPNLNADHVTFHPFMHASALMRKMNEEMDVAVLLNSFEHEESFKYNFSSKLVDYISAGLPVLCWGPASSGSIAWALSNGYDAIVTNNNRKEIESLVESFSDSYKRSAWAVKIRELGLKEFSYEKNHETFINAIIGNQSKA